MLNSKHAEVAAGELAHMVERSLSMRDVPGSIPGFSKFFYLVLTSLRQIWSYPTSRKMFKAETNITLYVNR